MAVLTGIRLDRFNEQNEMRNIDAKIEGIGFLIAKNEGELENLRIPVGGIVKLQDSGKMLERTANGWKDYEMGGGSSGGGGNTFEKLHGYYNQDASTWVQTDEEKTLNAELYTKWSAMLANDNYFIAVSKSINSKGSTLTQSFLCGIVGDAVVLYTFSYTIKLSSDGSILTIAAG